MKKIKFCLALVLMIVSATYIHLNLVLILPVVKDMLFIAWPYVSITGVVVYGLRVSTFNLPKALGK